MKHFIVTLLISATLTGCSLMPWSSDGDAEILTFLPADQLNQWDLTAKFSVSTAEGTESGSIRWILNPSEERLDVLSPTGSVVAQLTVTESEARLKTDDRETVASQVLLDLRGRKAARVEQTVVVQCGVGLADSGNHVENLGKVSAL